MARGRLGAVSIYTPQQPGMRGLDLGWKWVGAAPHSGHCSTEGAGPRINRGYQNTKAFCSNEQGTAWLSQGCDLFKNQSCHFTKSLELRHFREWGKVKMGGNPREMQICRGTVTCGRDGSQTSLWLHQGQPVTAEASERQPPDSQAQALVHKGRGPFPEGVPSTSSSRKNVFRRQTRKGKTST